MVPGKVTIIGYGRFGQVLASILKDDFDIQVHDSNPKLKDSSIRFVDLKTALQSEVIFYAVPIRQFERSIKSHLKYFKNSSPKLLIDVLSVKIYPAKVFQKYLPTNFQAILTHPLFGPDSVRVNGLNGLRIVMDQFKASASNYKFWKDYFASKGLSVLEISAKDHDQYAAGSQGVTFFISRVLANFGLKPTPIDTLWASKLNEIVKAMSNDSFELFVDLQTKNPYTKSMRLKLGESLDRIYNLLLPERINQDQLVLGIQGGVGSFNEEAAHFYNHREKIGNCRIKYLYTSEKVLRALHRGDIDRGQFAIHNSVGGIVQESVEAMARYKFRIIDEFAIKISHALMIRKEVTIKDIDTIMTHPQVLRQCKNNLAKKYPHLKQTSGSGELIDHSNVARLLSKGKLPKNIGVMGSKVLADLYNLQVVEDNLQDLAENFTSFLVVERLKS